MEPMKDVLTATQTADVLGVRRQRVYQLVERGELSKQHDDNGKLVIPAEDVYERALKRISDSKLVEQARKGDSPYMLVSDAAIELGVTPRVVNMMCNDGKLEFVEATNPDCPPRRLVERGSVAALKAERDNN